MSISQSQIILSRFTKCILLWVFFFIVVDDIFSQAPKNSPMQWGVIPQEQIAMKVCEFDSNASAVVLGDFGEWRIFPWGVKRGYKGILERHIRIKILKKEGIKWAEGELAYYSEDNIEKIQGFKGQTLNWDGKEMAIHPLNKEQKVDEKVTGEVSLLKYTFPRVQIGSIIEYTYNLSTFNFYQLRPWYFQTTIPTLYSEIGIKQNKRSWLNYTTIEYYLDSLDEKKKGGWILRNIPAIQDEPFVSNIENYRAHIEFENSTYSFSAKNTSDSTKKSAKEAEWKFLIRSLAPDAVVYGETVDSMWMLKAKVDSLVLDNPDPLDRLRLIYNYVRDEMKWDGENRKYAYRFDPCGVLAKKRGNSAEINRLLYTLLQMGGVSCEGMVLATLDFGLPLDNPIRTQFNQFIVYVQLGEKEYFLNATDKMRPYNLPALNDLAVAGLLLKEEGGGWTEIPNKYQAKQQAYALINLDDEGKITGNISARLDGYAAASLRKDYGEAKDKKVFWEQKSDNSLTETKADDLEIKNLQNPDLPIEIKYAIQSEDYSRKVRDFIYIDPFVGFGELENPFMDLERKYTIEMGHLISHKFIANIRLPDNYKIESLPKSTRIILPDKNMIFQFVCEQMDNQIQIMSDFQTSKATFPAEYYPALKQLYDSMIAKQQEQIVLKRLDE